MFCPNCRDKELYRKITTQGVEVDYCKTCEGVWLDKGEIYHFTKTPSFLRYGINETLKSQIISEKISPRAKQNMVSITLFGKVRVEYCPKTGGLWLDKEELEKLLRVEPKKLNITLDKKIGIEEKDRPQIDIEKNLAKRQRLSAIEVGMFPLPNLIVSSTVALVGLYALLVFMLILCVQFFNLTPFFALIIGVGIALFHFILGPYILDLSLQFLFKMSWLNPQKLPVSLKNFIDRLTKEKNMHFPKIGLIYDGSPQAFTYGHHPNNARIVISHNFILYLSHLNKDKNKRKRQVSRPAFFNCYNFLYSLYYFRIFSSLVFADKRVFCG